MELEDTALAHVVRSAWVQRSPTEAFRVFTEEIGAWWPLPSHGLFGTQAGTVVFGNGRLIEYSIEGNEAIWGEVISWDPPHQLLIAWHPGSDRSDASVVEVNFESEGSGTSVVVRHRGWEAFGAMAAQRRLAYVGPNAWGYVLDHFGDGAEHRPDVAETAGLTTAYAQFFDEAEAGGFGPAPAGEWSAEQVVAHVSLNDIAILGVCQAIIHLETISFENQTCQDLEVLTRWIEDSGSFDELIGRGRHLSSLVVRSLRRLSPQQRETQVHCRLSHDGQVVLNHPMPWEALALETQASQHLVAHTDQLRDLRG